MAEMEENGNGCYISMKKSEPTIIQPEKKTHNGFLFLSNLDQLYLHRTETAYLYKPNDEKSYENLVQSMKEALAKVLAHYYPLAGRLRMGSNGRLVVECNNEGVPFVEAEADCNMDDIGFEVPSVKTEKLIYTFHGAENPFGTPLLTAQVTRFKCQACALGIAISHVIIDGTCAIEFINSWAEIARGLTLTIPPFLDRTRITATSQPTKIDFSFKEFTQDFDINTMSAKVKPPPLNDREPFRCFHLEPEKIEVLKKMAMEDGSVKTCTTFEVLSGFAWRARTKALEIEPDQKANLLILVNSRSILNPPLPKGYFGNAFVLSACLLTAGELLEKPLSFAVQQVQNAKKRVDSEYVNSWVDYFEANAKRRPSSSDFTVSPWTGFPYGKADFGWGEPVGFGPASLSKLICLMRHGKDRKGITLVMAFTDSAKNKFEELLAEI